MKQFRNKTILTLFICIALFFATACTQETKSDVPIKIGWIGPLSGPSTVLGMDSITAAEIAVKEINDAGGVNGQQIQLITEDDQYNIAKTVAAYNKLVNVDGAKILIMNTYGGVFAIADKAKQDGVIIIDPLDCNSALTNLNNNIFCLATDSESIGQVLAQQATKQGLKKVGILYFNSDTFMPLVKDSFVKNYEGETLVESHVAGTNDFKTTITKYKEEGVEGLIFLGYDEIGIAMRQARELNFKGQFFATGTATSPGLQESSQGAYEDTIIAFWDAQKTEEPAKSFTEKFISIKERPPILDLASYPTYDSVKAVALAIESQKSSETEDIKKGLLQIKNMNGVTGDVSFATDGSVKITETAHILKGKNVELVK